MSGLAPRLRASSSLAILASLISFAPAAYAQTTVSASQATPVKTSTGGDVTIASGGSINIGGTNTAAITVDSPNNVTNSGTITANDGTNITGILITQGAGGATGTSYTIQNNTTITVSDSTLATTIPLTNGIQRYGIQVNNTSLFNGSINDAAGGSITIRGNNGSDGIYVTGAGGGITGSITNAGTIGVTGNNSYGILLDPGAQIQGGISVTGTVTSLGQGAGGIALNGTVGGQLYINTTVRADGYYNGQVTVSRPTDFTGLTANNKLQGGSAVSIGNSIGGGILVDTSGEIVTYGQAPSLLINGSATTVSANSGTAYGLLVNGSGTIRANGIYDNITSTAIQVGGAGTDNATIAGGISVAGSVKANSFAANSTGILIGQGGTVPLINNTGLIQATSQFGQSGIAPSGTATAITVGTGGSLGKIVNTGVIQAAVGNTAADIVGSQTQLDFFGTTIGTPFVPPKTADVSPLANALDLRGDIVPVTVEQDASATSTASAITGNIYFGDAGATLNLYSGTVTGAISFGNSAGNAIDIRNGATLDGNLTTTGSIGINVENGRLSSTSTTPLSVSSLALGSKGEIDFAVNSGTAQSGSATVFSAVAFQSGAKVGLNLDSPLLTSQTFTVIQTTGPATADLAVQPSLVLGNLAYFYNAQLVTNPTAGTIGVSVQERPFSQAGVVGTQSAYQAIFKGSYADTDIRDAFNAAPTQQGFKQLYNQMLPQYSGGLFEVLAQGAGVLSRVQADNPIAQAGNHGGGWTQEIGFGAVNATNSAPGFHGGGLGFALGWETPISKISSWGLSASYMRASVDDFNMGKGDQQAGSVYSVGAYWHEDDGEFHTDASLNIGVAEFNSIRNFDGFDLVGAPVSRSASAAWDGGFAQAHLGVSYLQPIGSYYIRPLISGDYFVLYQGSHTERNGGSGFDLSVASSTGKQGSITGGVAVGTQWGDKFFKWRPELMVGYKGVFGGPDPTVAAFAGGESFALPSPGQKSGPVGHLGVHGGNKYSDFGFEAGGEDRGDYHGFDGRVVARFRF